MRSRNDHDIFQQAQVETERGEHLYTLERPVWGYHSLTRAALRQHGDALLELALAMRQTGGILSVSYQEEQERDAITLLLLLLSTLRAQRASAGLIYPLAFPVIGISDIPQGYLLIHRAARIAGALNAMKQESTWWCDRIVIATGPADEWERLSSYLPIRNYPLSVSVPAVLNEVVDAECNLLTRHPAAADAYALVAAFDALGVTLPFSLMARTVGLDEDEAGVLVEQARSLLYWVERERPPGLLVSTKGELVTWRTMEALHGRQTEEFLQQHQRRVLQSVNSNESEERHAVVGLFQSLVAKGRDSWAGQLVTWGGLDAILREATAPERLAWSGILTHLGVHEMATHALREVPEQDIGRPGVVEKELTSLKEDTEAQLTGISALSGRAIDFVFRTLPRLVAPDVSIPVGMAAASAHDVDLDFEVLGEGTLQVTVGANRRGHLVATCETQRQPCRNVEVALIEVMSDLSRHIWAIVRTDPRGHADLGPLERLSPATRTGQYLLRVRMPEA